MLPALALMLSAASFTGCDSPDDSDVEALQAQLDDEDVDNLVAAEAAESDDEDGESRPSLEADEDLVDASRPTLATCEQWTPTTGQCERANIQCLDPEITPGPCSVLTQCIKCDVPWSGGV
ncbi:hypothetical protein [Nannocystis exedens]|nr:hypothetical protein [Nannocystis exedens]